MLRIGLASLLTTAAVLGTSGVASAAGWTQYVGLPGGTQFLERCSSSTIEGMGRLQGFSGREDYMIDGIRGVCEANSTYNPMFYHGGSGGNPFSSSCGSGRYVVGVKTWHGDYVNGIQVNCAGASTTLLPRMGGIDGNYTHLKCAPGEWAKGLRGMSGALLDQLSIYCAR